MSHNRSATAPALLSHKDVAYVENAGAFFHQPPASMQSSCGNVTYELLRIGEPKYHERLVVLVLRREINKLRAEGALGNLQHRTKGLYRKLSQTTLIGKK